MKTIVKGLMTILILFGSGFVVGALYAIDIIKEIFSWIKYFILKIIADIVEIYLPDLIPKWNKIIRKLDLYELRKASKFVKLRINSKEDSQ